MPSVFRRLARGFAGWFCKAASLDPPWRVRFELAAGAAAFAKVIAMSRQGVAAVRWGDRWRASASARFFEVESKRALDSLVWSHFLPRTGAHFAGIEHFPAKWAPVLGKMLYAGEAAQAAPAVDR